MYIPFTAESIIAGANKIASTKKIEKPWWFIGSTEAYISKTTAEKEMLAEWNEKDQTVETISTPANAVDWLSQNWKIAVVGFVALLILLKD